METAWVANSPRVCVPGMMVVSGAMLYAKQWKIFCNCGAFCASLMNFSSWYFACFCVRAALAWTVATLKRVLNASCLGRFFNWSMMACTTCLGPRLGCGGSVTARRKQPKNGMDTNHTPLPASPKWTALEPSGQALGHTRESCSCHPSRCGPSPSPAPSTSPDPNSNTDPCLRPSSP